MNIKRYEIYLADLNPTIGSEIKNIQKNNFAALSVGDILQYYLLPAALRNEFSESLYHTDTPSIESVTPNQIFPFRRFLILLSFNYHTMQNAVLNIKN